MQRLLITGASGFLGRRLCRAAVAAGWQVSGTYWQHGAAIPGVEMRRVDLTSEAAARGLVESVAPDAVIHAAAATKLDWCEAHPLDSERLNVTVTRWLSASCGGRNCRFVYVSTDQVFDGRSAPCREDTPAHAVNVYGRHKAAAEGLVLAADAGALVCRLPLLFGVAAGEGGNFLTAQVAALRAGREVRLFTDEYRTPVAVDVAADGILLAVERAVHGILHLGGSERVSRYEFGVTMAEEAGLDASRLVPVRQADVLLPAPRPADVSLDSSRAFALGYRPGPLREQLRDVFRAGALSRPRE